MSNTQQTIYQFQKRGLTISETKIFYERLKIICSQNKKYTYKQYAQELEKQEIFFPPKRTFQRYIKNAVNPPQSINFRNPKMNPQKIEQITKYVTENNLQGQTKTEFVFNVLPIFNLICNSNSTFVSKHFKQCYRQGVENVVEEEVQQDLEREQRERENENKEEDQVQKKQQKEDQNEEEEKVEQKKEEEEYEERVDEEYQDLLQQNEDFLVENEHINYQHDLDFSLNEINLPNLQTSLRQINSCDDSQEPLQDQALSYQDQQGIRSNFLEEDSKEIQQRPTNVNPLNFIDYSTNQFQDTNEDYQNMESQNDVPQSHLYSYNYQVFDLDDKLQQQIIQPEEYQDQDRYQPTFLNFSQ